MKNYECIGGPYHGQRIDRPNSYYTFQVAILPKTRWGWDGYPDTDITYTTKRYDLTPFNVGGEDKLFWIFEDLTLEYAVGYVNVMASKEEYEYCLN